MSGETVISYENRVKPKPFGHYFILEKIAQGGMAEIFKGLTYDFLGIKKFIVIKRILPHIAANHSFIEMLIDEAKIAVNLSHGNIAQIFDLGKVGDDYFIVMEYVDGKNLSQIQKKCREKSILIPIEQSCFFISELCQGLDYIHRKSDDLGKELKIVHRDISPQNIIVNYSGNVKIVDFGVAKAALKLGEKESGVLKGKFAYMSPEQAKGREVDYHSDLFSAGIILWELLTGQRLFKRKTNNETMEMVIEMTVLPPSHFRPEIPPELDQIVLKALEKNPQERYDSAHDMGLELTKFLLKNFPHFKPKNIIQFLSDLFGTSEDLSEPISIEKKNREEATLVDLTRSLFVGNIDGENMDKPEETAVVDPLEITFHSIFDEISWEEPKQVEKIIKQELQIEVEQNAKIIESNEEELSVTGVLTSFVQEDLKASIEKPKIKENKKNVFLNRYAQMLLILVVILFGLGVFYYLHYYMKK